MNSEMNTGDPVSSEAMVTLSSATLGGISLGGINLERVERERVNLDREGVRAMRHCLHELANVFTGVMIAGDLLSLQLGAGPLERYAAEICIGGERGCVLVREIRSQLLAACGEAEATPEALAESIAESADQDHGAAPAPEA